MRVCRLVMAALTVSAVAVAGIEPSIPTTDAVSLPLMINYQGKLSDSEGNPREGYFDMTFRIYSAMTGGTLLWQETQTGVRVDDGLFNVLLGSHTPISALPAGPGCFFEVAVGDEVLPPRVRMVSVPYAYHSDNTGKLQGRPVADLAPAADQVLTWNGNAWVPGDVAAAGDYIINQYSAAQSANFWITGVGRAQQLYAKSEVTDNVPAVWGDGTTRGSGVHAQTVRPADAAVEAYHSHATGTGIVGAGNNAAGSFVTTGSGGAFTGTGIGAYGKANGSAGTGVVGVGNNLASVTTSTDGSGGAFSGTKIGAYGAGKTTTGTGVVGVGNDAATAYLMEAGTGGAFTGKGVGAVGFGFDADNGTGLAGVGNSFDTAYYLVGGSGGAFTGNTCGAYGYARLATGQRFGGYFSTAGASPAYAYVALVDGTGGLYKINGAGTVSTIMDTREGKRNLFAPEMPEAWFEDVGSGRLESGHCRVNLDPLFTDCIAVDADRPLRVFIQLEDDCNGVYVRSDATGFDVRELAGGKSDARFSWRALGKWRGFEDQRFPDAPGPLPLNASPARAAGNSSAETRVEPARPATP